jgi:hypothetical protein
MAFGRWSGAVSGSFQFLNGNRSVVLQPNQPFSAGELVTVALSDQLRAADSTFIRPQGFATQFWATSRRLAAGSFSQIGTLVTGSPSRPYGGIAADLNHDRWLDVTLVNEDSGDLRVFMNLADGTGSFAPYTQPTFPVGFEGSPNEGADFNRDGHTDIAVSNGSSGTISVLFGNGAGGFGPQQSIPVGAGSRGIAVLDLEGDGDTDIVSANQFANNLSLHINNGQGVFGAPITLETGLSGEWPLASGDMDNDGIMDLVVGSVATHEIQILSGNGDGAFTPHPVQNAGGRGWMIALGDVNGDGNLDVSSANGPSNVAAILLGNGNGTLQSPVLYNIPSMGSGSNNSPIATDLGDWDGDGDLDWATSSFNGEFVILRNNGSGAFQFFTELDAPQAASCTLFFDFDNDGDLDMGLVDELANVMLLRRNDGLHSSPGDFDSDGDLDAVDVDALVQQIAAVRGNLAFDLTGDGVLNMADLTAWLAAGGATNLPSGQPYPIGDANLDGVVNGTDFDRWNANKFAVAAAWTRADFNADGVVDGTDFGHWNSNRTNAAGSPNAVPEPALIAMPNVILGFIAVSWIGCIRRDRWATH